HTQPASQWSRPPWADFRRLLSTAERGSLCHPATQLHWLVRSFVCCRTPACAGLSGSMAGEKSTANALRRLLLIKLCACIARRWPACALDSHQLPFPHSRNTIRASPQQAERKPAQHAPNGCTHSSCCRSREGTHSRGDDRRKPLSTRWSCRGRKADS